MDEPQILAREDGDRVLPVVDVRQGSVGVDIGRKLLVPDLERLHQMQESSE